MDLKNVWSAASQRVSGLLGQILRWRVEQVQLSRAQGVAGVIVAVCRQEHLREAVLVGAEQRVWKHTEHQGLCSRFETGAALLTAHDFPPAGLRRGGRSRQVVHGRRGRVCLLLAGVTLRSAGVHHTGDGNAAPRLFVPSVLQGVGDPAKVAAHFIQLLQKHKQALASVNAAYPRPGSAGAPPGAARWHLVGFCFLNGC